MLHGQFPFLLMVESLIEGCVVNIHKTHDCTPAVKFRKKLLCEKLYNIVDNHDTVHVCTKNFQFAWKVKTHASVSCGPRSCVPHLWVINRKSNKCLRLTRYVTGFGKINQFVTFDTSNIYGQNNALYSTTQSYSEYRISVYTELPENLWNIIGTYVWLW